jgi:hypothetical protein
MKCSRVRDKLMDYTSADLPPGELHRINEHLMGCEQCRAALELARRASSALNMLGSEEPAPALVSAVREKLARDRRVARPVLIPRLAMGFSAAALVALVIAGWLRYGPLDRTDVAVETAGNGHVQAPVPTAVPSAPKNTPPPSEPEPRLATNQSQRQARPGGRAAGSLTANSRREKEDPGPVPTLAEPDADSEPVILIAVQPKEPEIYVMHLDSEEEQPATELTVVREFDGGGNITSVTIHGDSSVEDSADTVVPAADRTELLDAPPTDDMRAGYPYGGGSARNA